MRREGFERTIERAARFYMTGVENLEAVLGDPEQDTYNLYGSRVSWYKYDAKQRKLIMDIEVIGSPHACPPDKGIHIQFCFDGVYALYVGNEGNGTIKRLMLDGRDYLTCFIDGYTMTISAEHMDIKPIEYKPKSAYQEAMEREEMEKYTPQQRALLHKSILELDLSVRVTNALWFSDARFVKDILNLSREELLDNRNFGKKSLKELTDWLEENGFSLRQD